MEKRFNGVEIIEQIRSNISFSTSNRIELENAYQDLMKKTPEEKARDYGIPLIPPIKPWPIPNPHGPVAICGQCGLEIYQVMGYCCPHPHCPCGLGGSWSCKNNDELR